MGLAAWYKQMNEFTMLRQCTGFLTHRILLSDSMSRIVAENLTKVHGGSKKQYIFGKRATILKPGRGQLHAKPHVRPISCHVASLSWQESEEELTGFFWWRFLQRLKRLGKNVGCVWSNSFMIITNQPENMFHVPVLVYSVSDKYIAQKWTVAFIKHKCCLQNFMLCLLCVPYQRKLSQMQQENLRSDGCHDMWPCM